jgi:hypothetical protein
MYEIKKTQNSNEYAVCTGKGLYFIEIIKSINDKYEITENKLEYYNQGRPTG